MTKLEMFKALANKGLLNEWNKKGIRFYFSEAMDLEVFEFARENGFSCNTYLDGVSGLLEISDIYSTETKEDLNGEAKESAIARIKIFCSTILKRELIANNILKIK
jgi:hypothetical protein